MADYRKRDESEVKINEPSENDEMMEAAGESAQVQRALRREIEREMAEDQDYDRSASGNLQKTRREALLEADLEGDAWLEDEPEEDILMSKPPRAEAGAAKRAQAETAASQEYRRQTGQDFEDARAAGYGRSRARQNARKTSARELYHAAPSQEDTALVSRAKSGSGQPAASEKNRPSAAGGGRKKKLLAAGGILAVLLVIFGGVYFVMAQRYRTVFFPNTVINGVDASGKTPEQVKELISDGIDAYTLTIKERQDKTEQITKEELGLHPVFDGSLETMLSAQNPYQWIIHQFKPSNYELKTIVSYDKAAFDRAVKNLNCMNPALMQAPQNAKISDYGADGFSIVPEVPGSQVISDKVEEGIVDAVTNLKTELSINDIGGYEAPEITKDDPAMASLLTQMNRCAQVKVTYQFGDKSEILDGSQIHEWLSVNADNTVGVSSGKVADYVSGLAAKYDTYNKAKTLKTTYGPIVTVRGGTYGWRINQSEEAAALKDIILSGESQTREPIYSQKAASHGENDYGNTYVEINLTAQHLYYYENGTLAVESDFVSGNAAKGLSTPPGTYPLNYKQKNAILKGENYKTPVDYWMPFNGGIGMHDASWRTSFGGTIYKNGGSHGCINLPPKVAKKIFESIKPGTPVLCYNLPGTERSGTTSTRPPETAPPQTEAPTQPETLAPGVFSPTVAPTQSAGQSTAAQQQPAGPGNPAANQPVGPGRTEPTQPSAQSTAAPTQPAPISTQAPAQNGPAQGPAGPGSDSGNRHDSGPGFS